MSVRIPHDTIDQLQSQADAALTTPNRIAARMIVAAVSGK